MRLQGVLRVSEILMLRTFHNIVDKWPYYIILLYWGGGGVRGWGGKGGHLSLQLKTRSWRYALQVKNITNLCEFQFFRRMGTKKQHFGHCKFITTIQNHVDNNRNSSDVKMLRPQNPGRVAKTEHGLLKKCEMARGRCRRRDLVFQRLLCFLFVPLQSLWFIVILDMEIHGNTFEPTKIDTK